MSAEVHMNKQMIVYSQYANKAITAGRKQGMRFQVVNQRGVPDEPFYEDGWWYEILKSDSQYITHSDLQERLKVIRASGVPIKELIIAHEAPKLLTAPIAENKPEKTSTDTDVSFDATPVVEAIVGVLGAILIVVGVIFVAAIRIDPALIAVLPDGTFLQVATWYD
jgi:hypothetical protein